MQDRSSHQPPCGIGPEVLFTLACIFHPATRKFLGVLPLNIVDNWSSPFGRISGRFFSSLDGPERPSHPAMRPHPPFAAGTFTVFLWHDAPPTSGLRGAQADFDGTGQESTSRVVHRRLVLPAAIAGVRCR